MRDILEVEWISTKTHKTCFNQLIEILILSTKIVLVFGQQYQEWSSIAGNAIHDEWTIWFANLANILHHE